MQRALGIWTRDELRTLAERRAEGERQSWAGEDGDPELLFCQEWENEDWTQWEESHERPVLTRRERSILNRLGRAMVRRALADALKRSFASAVAGLSKWAPQVPQEPQAPRLPRPLLSLEAYKRLRLALLLSPHVPASSTLEAKRTGGAR